MVDIARRWDSYSRQLLKDVVHVCAEGGSEFLLVLNKVDLLVSQHEFLEEKLEYVREDVEHTLFGSKLIDYRGLEGQPRPYIYLTSARQNRGVKSLRRALLNMAKPGTW